MTKVLLYSGGTDSWLIDKIWKPDIKLYINIQGKYSSQEIQRLPKDVHIIDFPFLGTTEDKESLFVPLRNLYFLMIASYFGDVVCLGATIGDGSKDKCFKFLEDTESFLSYLLIDKKVNKNFKIEKRFSLMSKGELLETYLKNGGSIEEYKKNTFSCYTPIENQECYSCYPCFRKFAILYSHGYKFSEEIEEKMWFFIKKYIIPTKEEGGYTGTYYTERLKESKDLIFCVEKLKQKYEGVKI